MFGSFDLSAFFTFSRQDNEPELEMKRRSVPSYVENFLLSLEESGFPAAVNDAFHRFHIRDKQRQERGRKEQSRGAIEFLLR
jgi:hypothetical protein